MAKVPNAVEILPKISTASRVHERYRQTTDRQTTDGRATAYSERSRSLKSGKEFFFCTLLFSSCYKVAYEQQVSCCWLAVFVHCRCHYGCTNTFIFRKLTENVLKSENSRRFHQIFVHYRNADDYELTGWQTRQVRQSQCSIRDLRPSPCVAVCSRSSRSTCERLKTFHKVG